MYLKRQSGASPFVNIRWYHEILPRPFDKGEFFDSWETAFHTKMNHAKRERRREEKGD